MISNARKVQAPAIPWAAAVCRKILSKCGKCVLLVTDELFSVVKSVLGSVTTGALSAETLCVVSSEVVLFIVTKTSSHQPVIVRYCKKAKIKFRKNMIRCSQIMINIGKCSFRKFIHTNA